MAELLEQGNVVKSFVIGNTRIKICDDYCRDRTREEANAILRRISMRVQEELSAAAAARQ